MSEKQEFLVAEGAEVAPPAYAKIAVVDADLIESLTTSARCPTWIRRLPLTLPLTHALLSIPTAVLLARSLSEAVLIAFFYSCILFSATTALITRALRRNEGARAHAGRSLAMAATTTILWPLMSLLLLSPALQHHHRHCPMMARLRNHSHYRHTPSAGSMRGRPFHIVNPAPVIATSANDNTPSTTVLRGGANGSPAAVVFSSKGSRILIGSGPEAEGHINAAVAALTASIDQTREQLKGNLQNFVVSSKGVKSLIGEEKKVEQPQEPQGIQTEDSWEEQL